MSPTSLPFPKPVPTGQGHESGQVAEGPLSPKPITAPPLPKALPTTSRPTPELAVKMSDLDLICVVDDAAGGRAKAAADVVNLLSDEETDEESADHGEERLVRGTRGVESLA